MTCIWLRSDDILTRKELHSSPSVGPSSDISRAFGPLAGRWQATMQAVAAMLDAFRHKFAQAHRQVHQEEYSESARVQYNPDPYSASGDSFVVPFWLNCSLTRYCNTSAKKELHRSLHVQPPPQTRGGPRKQTLSRAIRIPGIEP